MKTFHRLATLVASSLALASPMASAQITVWHANLTWAGQGMCSAEFVFDSGLEPVSLLKVHFDLRNAAGKTVARDELEVEAFGQSNADRYAQAFVESDAICDDGLKLVVTQADAMIDGKRVDLLKSGGLKAKEFRPLTIQIP